MFRRTLPAVVCGALTALAGSLSAADFALVKDGKAVSAVIVKKGAPAPVSFGAKELSLYLGKITKASPKVAEKQLDGIYNVYVGTVKDADLVKKAGIDPKSLKEDGFTLTARKDGLYIIGQNPRGALYGCYEILKKYGGIRWLVPGDDGEYVPAKSTVAVPEQKSIHNPFLRERKTVAGEMTAYRWLARNNMHGEAYVGKFIDLKTGKRTAQADMLDSLGVTGAAYGGHILTFMMGGASWKDLKKNIDILFKEHPEYFPLIKGKRTKFSGANDPNPCISNPALLDLMAENLYKYAGREYGAQHPITIGNNDTTIWCECEKCRALDNPAAKGSKGERSDRYWYMVNEIAKRVWKKNPNIKLGGWAYQDFWYPPTKVKVDPRIRVLISYNHQCWRHSIRDPKCTVNQELCRIMAAWKKTGHPFLVNRDEIGAYDGGGSPGVYYLPSEKVLFDNFKSYASLGFNGSSFCVNSPFPATLGFMKKIAPYYGKNYFWYAMWQICYLSSLSMWNPDFDFDREYETINRLYYGKAWDNGFREYRRLLTKYFKETPGCIGWGLGSPLGRCLDQAGSEEKLKALLAKSIAAAKQDKDPRVLKHVLRDKEILEMTWFAHRKIYLKNFKELNVYRQTSPIRIDGVLDEADWKNADSLSNFKPGGNTKKGTKIQQSYVRVVYAPDTLYIAVECMEPNPEKIVAGKKVNRDDTGWANLGNSVELFYNFPDMAEKYYHLAINSNGQLVDAVHGPGLRNAAFDTKAKIATKVLKDRWILEIAIPCSEIGMKCYDGSTWKLNVARHRKIKLDPKDNIPYAEASSCCNGAFHGAANFVNIKFTPKRGSGYFQNRDNAAWKNADFNDVIPDAKLNRYDRYSRYGKWKFEDPEKLVPKAWGIGAKAVGTVKKEGNNYYIQLEKDYITQYFVSGGKGRVRIQFRARGKGSFFLWTCSFRNYRKGEGANGYKQLKETAMYKPYKLTDQWQTFRAETKKIGIPTERIAIRFTVHDKSVLELDDVYVTLIPE